MNISKKDSIIARSIIMNYYDNPKYKISETINDANYISFINKSNSCVDNITFLIKIKKNIVEDVKYFGIGCAISLSSTEIMLGKIINLNIKDALHIVDKFENLLEGIEEEDSEKVLDDLIVFHNIHKQPNRISCAKIAPISIREIFKQYNNKK